MDGRMGSMESRMGSMDGRMNSMDGRMKSLEEGQEQIKLRLNNVAYRFELVELQRRVKLLEKKAGVRA